MIQQEHCIYRTSDDKCGRFRNPIKCGVPLCRIGKRDTEPYLKYKETMEREQAKKWAELFTAYGEGKTIQIKHYIHFGKSEDVWEWEDIDGDGIDSQRCLSDYRIKPQPKIRPFGDARECWSVMMEHSPFGWVKVAGEDCYYQITDVDDDGVCLHEEFISYEELLSSYRFIKGFVDDDYLGVEEKK